MKSVNHDINGLYNSLGYGIFLNPILKDNVLTFLYGALISIYELRGILLNQAKEISVMTEKKEKKEKKDYCDATDQRKIVEKMTDCDKSSSTDKDLTECYTKIIEEDEGCMS